MTIKEYRAKTHIQQIDLAKRIGISPSLLSKLETGVFSYKTSEETKRKIDAYFDHIGIQIEYPRHPDYDTPRRMQREIDALKAQNRRLETEKNKYMADIISLRRKIALAKKALGV